MTRLTALNPQTTTGKSSDLFAAINKKLGMVPNMMRTMGASPAVLEGYLSFNAALGSSAIGAKLGELIALTVANANGCEYCNAAHSYIGEKLVGIDTESIRQARSGQSKDPKIRAALVFALKLVETRGKVYDADLADVKSAGFTEPQIAEIIAHTALNIFTNYFNNTAQTLVDFPHVDLVEPVLV